MQAEATHTQLADNYIKNILVELKIIFMIPYLEFKRCKDFEKKILPKIDVNRKNI